MFLPMLLTDGGSAFDDPAWYWEVKFDGYRAIITKTGPAVRIFTRHQHEITPQFPEVAAGIAESFQGDGVLDGELV